MIGYSDGSYEELGDGSCEKPKTTGAYGWICPVCGRGNAPFATTCPCKPIKYEVTCQSSFMNSSRTSES